ncbi:MAG: 7-carboxy-7-deazaguanine synthase QueE [Proteobacteria bacterium]|nr:7-carboxy-7-deazaguanine synthase QueE [Pseudomonadota bacterium]
MFGNNPIRPPVKSDGQILEVQQIFPTLQGEGPFTGHPAVFIRLGGCNLACSFCDTEFESFAPMPLSAIMASVQELAGGVRRLAVITGGEPMRQNIVPLCEALLAAGYTVQIETNGTLLQPVPPQVHIVCSPKNAGRGYSPVREDVLARAQALKFIISHRDPLYREVPELGQSQFATPVYVQPMDEYDPEVNATNRAYAAQLAQEFGYILSLQTHKILGID